jgi:hypothetical protein
MLAQDRPVSPVVVDPYLARHLRPHQVGAAPKLQHKQHLRLQRLMKA